MVFIFDEDTLQKSPFFTKDTYALAIGVDRGIILASFIAAKQNIPHGLISYELYFAEETGSAFKAPEIEACRGLLFAVCQDRVRSSHLARENNIPMTKIIDIPVAGRSVQKGVRSYALHKALGLNKNKKIALYIGAVVLKWAAIDMLLESTTRWSDNWVLVLHHTYGNASTVLHNKIGMKNVFASPFPRFPLNQMHTVLHAADLGIAFYQPLTQGNYTDCKNLKYIGMASGKIASYLQHGLPIMVNEIGEMSTHVRQHRLGIVAGKFKEIPSLVNSLSLEDLSEYRQNSYSFFEDKLDLNVTIKPLLNMLGSLSNRNILHSTKANEILVKKDIRTKGLTIIAPDNYTNQSWYEEAQRLLGEDAEIAVLKAPSGEGFEKLTFKDTILFLGASHHLTGLFDTPVKIQFWNNIPSKKYFYQYERVIGSFWPENEQKERNVHKITAEAYAVQDEYDAVIYEKTFGEKAVWLPDMISVERVQRGKQYQAISIRPIDILFIGKIQGKWYHPRQDILKRVELAALAQNLKPVIIDTSFERMSDREIEHYYAQAKVVVNPIGAGNFFNIRFFEALAAGCICLQQVDNKGFSLKAFQKRFQDYNAVYFTSADLEQRISTLFSDIPSYERRVPMTSSLLLSHDTGETRFTDMGIMHASSHMEELSSDLYPIIFIHKGDSNYLEYTLSCAKAFNPHLEIFLLGDDSNKHYRNLGIVHVPYNEYEGEESRLFESVFQCIAGKEHPREKWWVHFVFKRWFHIYYFLKARDIKRFWTFDSDTLILTDLGKQAWKFKAYDCTEQCNGICMNGFVGHAEIVKRYIDTINELFQNKAYLSQQREDFRINTDYAFTEMRAYSVFKEKNHIKTIRLNTIIEGETFDDIIIQQHDMEYEQGSKKLYFINNCIFFNHLPTNKLIKVNALNMSGASASLIKDCFDYATASFLPVHFFTIVLNGEPFIRHHIEVLRQLRFKWHWHIIEGVADLKHDTAWSLQFGARITDNLHKSGLSNDGTTEYLDDLAGRYPEDITIYRKQDGSFWDGKIEMVSAPLAQIEEECLLWQVDVDELWTVEQLSMGRKMFIQQPEKTAAFYFCHYFVGTDIVITTRDTYGNNSSYEWLRTWHYKAGDRWIAHEPPRLCRQTGKGIWRDLASLNPIMHSDTESLHLVFQHYAYATEAQLQFKEQYFGYAGAVTQWKRLQEQTQFPVFLKDYFSWVKDNALVNTTQSQNIRAVGRQNIAGEWQFIQHELPYSVPKNLLWVRTDSIGDAVLSSSMLPYIREKFGQTKITVLCQEHIQELYESCPFVDGCIPFHRTRAYQDESYRNDILRTIQGLRADVTLNPVYSREPLTDFFAKGSNAKEMIALNGNLSNISAEERDYNNSFYTRLLPSSGTYKPEIDRHKDFLKEIGIDVSILEPVVWLEPEDKKFADIFFNKNNLDPGKTIALFAGVQHDIRIYEQYGTAISHLCRDNQFSVIAFGTSNDRPVNQQNLDSTGVHTINLSGEMTLRQTASIIKSCRLAVGAETSIAHIACAVGTPNVILTGGGHFGRFIPYSPLTSIVCLPLDCYHCDWHCNFERVHCIKDILPEVFAESVRQTVDHQSAKPRIFVQGESLWNTQPGSPSWKWFNKFLNMNTVEIIPIGDVPDIPSSGCP
ncbi:MAG: hypothetical protein L6290_04145, partial [Thermodesulfovibrionales bacterium]|nr:hypothetical protein [Thermodesulfovibrionales bacterium]